MSTAPSSSETFNGRFTLYNRRDEIEQAQLAMMRELEQRQFDRASSFAIRLALEEAITNAFKHGNREDPSKVVVVEFRVEPNRVAIEVVDEGEGFDPASVPDPTEHENVEIPSGRGLTLMRAFMTEIEIIPPGNRVRMTYQRP